MTITHCRCTQALGSHHNIACRLGGKVTLDNYLPPYDPTQMTYVLEHNPNCPSPYKVRLPRGVINIRKDAIGYGRTFAEAFEKAYDELRLGKFDG